MLSLQKCGDTINTTSLATNVLEYFKSPLIPSARINSLFFPKQFFSPYFNKHAQWHHSYIPIPAMNTKNTSQIFDQEQTYLTLLVGFYFVLTEERGKHPTLFRFFPFPFWGTSWDLLSFYLLSVVATKNTIPQDENPPLPSPIIAQFHILLAKISIFFSSD